MGRQSWQEEELAGAFRSSQEYQQKIAALNQEIVQLKEAVKKGEDQIVLLKAIATAAVELQIAVAEDGYVQGALRAFDITLREYAEKTAK